MNQKYIYNICIGNIYILFIFSAVRVSEGSYKPLFSSKFEGSNGMIHFSAFLEQVPWDEADVTCKLYFGYLFSGLPENSTFRQQLKERGIVFLWVGIRRKGNFYSYPADLSRTLLYKEKTDNGKWGNTQVIGNFWIHGERFLDDCVVLDVLTGKLMTRDCGLNFPFVCESNGNLTENNIDCPKNWNLAIPLSITGVKCISGINDARLYSEAEIFCRGNESRLATGNEYEILESRNQLPLTVEDKGFWAQIENAFCAYRYLGSDGTVIAHKPAFCSKPKVFICVKSMEKEDFEVSIQVDPSVNFIDYGPMSSWNISSETNDIMTCGKNEHRNLIYQWFKDDVPIECFTYVCRISFLGSNVMWKIDGNDHRVRQGSYHCEVRHRGLVKSYSSQKIDHFYSGVASYTIDIRGIEREKYVDHSQNGFAKKMQKINPAIETISGDSNALWDFKSLKRIGETYSMKLVLFINRTNGYNDAEAYKNLSRSFQENISSFWGELGENISLIVHSADVCFQDDSNSNNMCSNEIEWNTTKQVKNVLTKRACLDEERKFVHRECKGSLVDKAEWSDFNCSVCKNFTERYQDQTVQCPHGYDKFKNQDLCFRIYHEKENWHDAHKTCAESASYMLDIPYMNDIGSVESLWLSFKYSQGRIQGFGKKPINLKTLYEKKEMLLENITGEGHELYCVSAVRERSEYKFKLENCSLKMSFVCVQRVYELMSSVKFASTWVKQRKLKNMESCYYFENSPYSWTEIGKFCEETFFGAKLLNGILDINSYRYLKKLIIDQQFNVAA